LRLITSRRKLLAVAIGNRLARGKKTVEGGPHNSKTLEVQNSPATDRIEVWAEEIAVLSPPDLSSGNDGKLPLELRVVFAYGTEFGRAFGPQSQLVQLAQELGLRGILVIGNPTVEAHKNEFSLAILTNLKREVGIIEVRTDIAVAPGGITHDNECSRVVHASIDRCDRRLWMRGYALEYIPHNDSFLSQLAGKDHNLFTFTIGNGLARGEDIPGVVQPVKNVAKVQAAFVTTIIAEERVGEKSIRLPPDLLPGNDHGLPLELGVVFPDGTEFGRAFRPQAQLVQLAHELGLRGVLIVPEFPTEADEDKLALAALARLDREVYVVEIGVDVAVVPARIAHGDQRA
jgi:hypothetical protein